MASSRSAGGRSSLLVRALVGCAAFAAFGATLGGPAQPSAAAPASGAPSTTTTAAEPSRPTPAAEEPRLRPLAARDEVVRRAALAQVGEGSGPAIVVTGSGSSATSVVLLPPAPDPYDLADVARRLPSAFGWRADHELVVAAPIVLAPGAALVIDSRSIASLRLLSTAGRYVTIRGTHATITLRGHDGQELAVSSLDPSTGRPDLDRRDGRAYIQILGGALEVDHARVSYLGFSSTGATSGVAWTAYDGRSARGGATASTFSHNYYGAYVAGGEDLRIDRSSFVSNVLYGFDPHTATNGTVVSRSRADSNGRHGFIFSEGCDRNLIRDSTATGNRGVGFMIDDGTLTSGLGRPSSGNHLVRVSADDNGQAGIVIEGGTGNTVDASRTSGQPIGIWVRNQAMQTQLTDNRIVDAVKSGIRLGPGLGDTEVAGNRIVGGREGIRSEGGSATWISGGVISSPSLAGLRLEGDQRHARFTDLTVVAPHAHEVELDGKPATIGELADLVPGSAPPTGSPGWSLVSTLHRMVFALWALILVPAALTRLGARRRWTPS